jgi:triacylglycerol lipase
VANPFPPGFDPAQALRYGGFVEQAYRQYYQWKRLAGQPPFEVPEGYRRLADMWCKERPSSAPFGFAALSPDGAELVVAIRGSEDGFEWKDDIVKSDQLACDTGGTRARVHRGFDVLYQSQFWTAPDSPTSVLPMDGALPHLGLAGPTSPRLVLAGHSVGAPLATRLGVACALAAGSSRPAPVLYSFAGPRMGDPAFADLVDRLFPTVYRVVNKWDLVPRFPPEHYFDLFTRRIYRYQHFKGEVVVDGGFSVNILANHVLDTYLRGLRALSGAA